MHPKESIYSLRRNRHDWLGEIFIQADLSVRRHGARSDGQLTHCSADPRTEGIHHRVTPCQYGYRQPRDQTQSTTTRPWFASRDWSTALGCWPRRASPGDRRVVR